MKFITWLGIMPLFFGIKLLYKWTIEDSKQWDYFSQKYKNGLIFRLITAIGLIVVGLWLFFGVGEFFVQRY